MTLLTDSQMQHIFRFLDQHAKMQMGDIITTFLDDKHKDHLALHSVVQAIEEAVKSSSLGINQSSQTIREQCYKSTTNLLREEMALLTSKPMDFHFFARKMTENKLKEFNIQAMSEKIGSHAPHLWNLLDMMSNANS